MTGSRFAEITGRYAGLRVAVIGDFCLDRYLEIDPARNETSIETDLTVYNITHIRSQPGGAGTILNNLAALGVGKLFPIGFSGDDGEGYELRRALATVPGADLQHFFQSDERHTFTYAKPLVCAPGDTPRELNRLDIKNWSPTPEPLQELLIRAVETVANEVDVVIALDQVDVPETGVITSAVREALGKIGIQHSRVPIFADSRRGLREWPQLIYKMNARELAAFSGSDTNPESQARQLAATNGLPVFVTLAEKGMLAADPLGNVHHQPCFPVRGEIDIVGAGDAVMANLAVSYAAGATLAEAIELASAAATVVIHQIGTTGTASVAQLGKVLIPAS